MKLILKTVSFFRRSLLIAGFSFFILAVFFNSAQSNVVKPSLKPSILTKVLVKPQSKPQFSNKGTLEKEGSFVEKIVETSFSFDNDNKLYENIFLLQHGGDLVRADQLIRKLDSDLLMGHVLAQRYLHSTAYKASSKELSDWLEKYSDHPQSKKIYKLAKRKAPKTQSSLIKPVSRSIISGNLLFVSYHSQPYQSTKTRTVSQERKVKNLSRDIKKLVKRNSPTLALNILNSDYNAQFLDDIEYDRLRANIATGFYYAAKYDQARKLAQASLGRSGFYVPQAGWIAGLSLWVTKQYKQSAHAFEIAAESPYASGWLRSAASYWASRAHAREGNTKKVKFWLNRAIEYPRSFYGVLAFHSLGEKPDLNWKNPSLKKADIRLIQSQKLGRRAHALLKSGQFDLASQELMAFDVKKSADHKKALIAYALHYQLSDLLIRIGNAFKTDENLFYDSALYPIGEWIPLSQYKLDPTLVHAFIRQESRFVVDAYNPSGATGLMQLMPSTANYVTQKNIYKSREGKEILMNPEENLEIGQQYLQYLLNNKHVNGDLLLLAIAYNAGPGNLAKWKNNLSSIDDPLLFIESIPYDETRAFVERVLSNYWLYRYKFKQKIPSLHQVAEGEWPSYKAQKP